MPREEYVCGSCGNRVATQLVDKRVAGSGGMARVIPPTVICEKDGESMERLAAAQRQREVGGTWGT